MRFQPATNTQHACSSLHHTCPRGLAHRATPASESTARATTGRSRCCARRHSHTSQAENVGWSLSLQEWPFGQDPRCPGCVFHYSPHYPARAPRAHARAHTPGYSSWRRVSPCGPPPLSTSVGNSYQRRRKCKAPKGAEPLHKRCRCDPGWLLRRVGAIPTTGLPLIRRKARKGVGDDACSCVFPSLSMLLMVLLLLLLRFKFKNRAY